ncbi:hypothetical protein MELE44368_03145 [Mycolicibacterium elephantis DSM 44368]|uniref:Uncharacterized protein n=1 Tax=Mycolicibacterium elephantis DSM 44368 TaxID=1335622 RepID=A0A439DV91_9MYCO|nr:hypothetical protein MELE44368_03145 [Mycolicibacterium elephantis DSM 44368]
MESPHARAALLFASAAEPVGGPDVAMFESSSGDHGRE